MAPKDFKLETTFSDRSNVRWLALAAAVVMLTGIGLTIGTSLPETLLPMTDESMRALIPLGFDGGQSITLKTVDHEVTGNMLRVFGELENRSSDRVQNVMVVIEPFGVSKRPAKPVEALVEPSELRGREKATFEVTTELDEPPATYKVRFRIKDGPFLPHKDERTPPPAAPEPAPTSSKK